MSNPHGFSSLHISSDAGMTTEKMLSEPMPQSSLSYTIGKAVIIWLLASSFLVFAIIVIGGVTRLTESGLSMTEWRPFLGVLPPLSDGEWQRVFELYRESPEYRHVNRTMDLVAFKQIFFWEYAHRMAGRLVGIIWLAPLAYFIIKRRLPAGSVVRLAIISILGAAQGLIGWWMVRSGLSDNPYVAPYRLAIHLGVALTIFGLLLWSVFDLIYGRSRAPRGHALGMLAILSITVIAGAFVAGLDGGLIYNEYPLMGGRIIPIEYGTGGMTDALDNPASAQFHHRVLALLTLVMLVGFWLNSRRDGFIFRADLMLAVGLSQFLLGLMTLLYAVPLGLGVIHQAGAATLLASLLWVIHGRGQAHN